MEWQAIKLLSDIKMITSDNERDIERWWKSEKMKKGEARLIASVLFKITWCWTHDWLNTLRHIWISFTVHKLLHACLALECWLVFGLLPFLPYYLLLLPWFSLLISQNEWMYFFGWTYSRSANILWISRVVSDWASEWIVRRRENEWNKQATAT